MKNGFRLVYHKSLTGKDKVDAETCLMDFVLALKGSYNYAKAFNTKGGRASNLKWKALGLPVGVSHCVNEKLVLRRLSKNRRIFGIVPRDLVFSLNGYACSTQYKRCICPKCTWNWTSGMGFTMAEPFKDSDYVTFYESGDIKG